MIYVKADRAFDDYNFFIWGMTVVLEDFKDAKEIQFTVHETPATNIRSMLHEWMNKTEDVVAAHGIKTTYVHTTKDAGVHDYVVYFTNTTKAIRPSGKRYNYDRVFVTPKS